MIRNLLILFLFSSPIFAKQEHTLFVVHAKQGELKPSEKFMSDWELQLSEVDQSVTFFSDPPSRRAGTYPLETFLKLWLEKKVKKEAGFIFFEVDSVDFSDIPVEVVSADYDSDSQSLTLAVKLLKPVESAGKQTLHEVTLFIDLDAKI